tara:strand:+ start:12628 stop:13080 length:453 start_codon:yes stop_codon:yes gene_type:complete
MPNSINTTKKISPETQAYLDKLHANRKIAAPVEELKDRVKQLCDKLHMNLTNRFPRLQDDYSFTYTVGKRYIKIIEITGKTSNHISRSVHAFVDRNTGDVYKPAGWAAPTKHVRYNLLNEKSFKKCLEKADHCGGYLYMDRSGKFVPDKE